ncbi:MAG: glycoside hydrolase family 2 TIM barrel-domain containing protein [Bryobacteraceae bacterium]
MDRRTFCATLPAAAGSLRSALAASEAPGARQQLLFDYDWRFLVGDPPGAQSPSFDASSWRSVTLPHDWSIEGKFDPKAPMGGSGGYLPAGIGWYRRAFQAPAAWKGNQIEIEFEGVYMNATVFINGRDLGTRPYGYSTFRHDLTPHLNFGGSNVVAVRVDQSRHKNTRWYSGSGIYRHVWLSVTGPLHVDHWGVFVTTPEVSEGRATVSVKTRVANGSGAASKVTLRTLLYDPAGTTAGQAESAVTVEAGATAEVTQRIAIQKPALWSVEAPRLYRAVTRVISGGRVADEVATPFGIRSIGWSPEKGFLLNGSTVKLAGGCAHHDLGPLGAAAFDRAEERRVQVLKAAGFNAIRTAHNPPSPAFLDACDRLGMLVIDESFDCWETGKNPHDYGVSFKEWWRRDTEAMVLRDRNHPSVVIWSIGNEIPERGKPRGAELARIQADFVRSLDPTRPITSALNNVNPWTGTDDFFAALDIGGYNYNLNSHVQDHQRVPARIMACTESFLSQVFEYWEMIQDNPYIVGDFVWTAIDYLGESGIGRWDIRNVGDTTKIPFMGNDASYPWHGSDCGDLDICGFRKASSHYRNIVWDRGEKLYLGVRLPVPEGKEMIVSRWAAWPVHPSWTWPGWEGKPLQVEVYSRYDAVRLFLGDKLIEEKPTTRGQQFKASFTVPYTPGVLRAVGIAGGKPAGEVTLRTAGEPVQLRLTADRTSLRADGQDLSYITVEALDKSGQPHPHASQLIGFQLSGAGAIAAVGNADMTSEEAYQASRRRLFNGKALVVVRTTRAVGTITLTASAPGLKPATVRLQSRGGVARPAVS